MFEFEEIGRLPAAEDNCAIAIRTLAAGTKIVGPSGGRLTLSHSVLEGHRFAVRTILSGASLLSWGMTFGRALRAAVTSDPRSVDSIPSTKGTL